MVTYEDKDIWYCPYCRNEYDDYDKAYDCTTECADIDKPTHDNKAVYTCDGCEEEYEAEEKAEGCEENHKENQDKYYDKLNIKKLEEAGNHPSQVHL